MYDSDKLSMCEEYMLKMFVVFCILTCCIFWGVSTWRNITGKEKWQFVKLLTFAIVCGIIANMLLVGIYILF